MYRIRRLFSAPVPKLLQAEMEIGYLSLPVTQLTYDDPLSTTHAHCHYILRMGLGGGVARWYWTTLSVIGRDSKNNRRLKLSLGL